MIDSIFQIYVNSSAAALFYHIDVFKEILLKLDFIEEIRII